MTFAEELTEVVRKARREESDRKRQATQPPVATCVAAGTNIGGHGRDGASSQEDGIARSGEMKAAMPATQRHVPTGAGVDSTHFTWAPRTL